VSGELLPARYEDLVRRARDRLDPEVFEFICGSAGRGDGERENAAAFSRRQLVPRVLRDVSDRDWGLELLGTRLSAPLLLAPVGALGLIREGGEVEAAATAEALGIGLCHSTHAAASIEPVAEAMDAGRCWAQMTWPADEELGRSFLSRAERAGCGAAVVTVDTPVYGWRPSELERPWPALREGAASATFTSDPVFRASLAAPPEVDPAAAMARWKELKVNPGLDWEGLRRVRDATALPLVLKGILDPDDAELALECGVDAIVVSNHGGRHLDGSVAALDALAEVAARVDSRLPLLFDSGVRSGTDLVKALALGADAILLGRPYVLGLALGGRTGLKQVVSSILAEADSTLALCGQTDLASLDLAIRPRPQAAQFPGHAAS